MEQEKIDGKTLIEMGYKPSKWFGNAIEYGNKNNLSREDLKKYIDSIRPKTVEPRETPIKYNLNIEAQNELEQNNIDMVVETMNELMKVPTIVGGAIMPDACPTGEIGQIPVGGLAITKNAIHPAMHSADICCSVMMTNLGKVSPKDVLDIAQQVTHFGPGGRTDPFDLPHELEEKIKSNTFLKKPKSIVMAKTHLGTQGDGNHFLFVGRSEKTGETILVTHHGSRGFGAYLYSNGMKVAENFRKEISPKSKKKNAWILYDTEEGKSYWEALQIVREWTKLNHTLIHDKIGEKMKIDHIDRIWNEHNFVFKDEDLFYHAKGATPLDIKFIPDAKNNLRLIPLNMTQPVLIVSGETNQTNLGFAPHGAGRNVSRKKHRQSLGHLTDEEIFAKETQEYDIRFFFDSIDTSELPSAYKDADHIQRQMEKFDLAKVEDKILPYGSIMAGDWQRVFDWKSLKKKKS